MFLIYPGHGVGMVLGNETKTILDKETVFVSLKIIHSEMIILFEQSRQELLGIREPMSKDIAVKCARILAGEHEIEFRDGPWNKRYREFMEIIRINEPLSLATALVDLRVRAKQHVLSFGERKMLDTASNLLEIELAVVTGEITEGDLL